MRKLFLLAVILIIAFETQAQNYAFFTNSDNVTYYDPSYLFSNSPSTLATVNSSKFPVSTDTMYLAGNALKLTWKSGIGGNWGAAIAAPGWSGHDITIMDSITIMVFAPVTIPDSALPTIYLEDLSNQKTDKINLSAYTGDITAGVWTKIKIPVSDFKAKPGSADLTRIKVIYVGQSVADATSRTLFLDEIYITGNFNPNLYKHIVVLGSSTSAGTGASPIDSAWVPRFTRYLKTVDTTYRVINLGVGGYSTYNVMPTGFTPPGGRPNPSTSNNITKALTYNPVAVLINLPSNDAAGSYPMIEQIANYDTLTAILKRNNIKFWMTTTQPRNFSNQSQLNLLFAMRDSTFSRYGPHALDVWTPLAQPNGFILAQFGSGDGIHLNNAGHKIVYERFRDAVNSSVETVEVGIPLNYILQQNYPNPFNPTTTIQYSIATEEFVNLRVYNSLGREVAYLVKQNQKPGNYSVEFDATRLPSGIYFYTIQSQSFTKSMKMVLVK